MKRTRFYEWSSLTSVIFSNINGWTVVDYDLSDHINIDVTNSSTNAFNLTQKILICRLA